MLAVTSAFRLAVELIADAIAVPWAATEPPAVTAPTE